MTVKELKEIIKNIEKEIKYKETHLKEYTTQLKNLFLLAGKSEKAKDLIRDSDIFGYKDLKKKIEYLEDSIMNLENNIKKLKNHIEEIEKQEEKQRKKQKEDEKNKKPKIKITISKGNKISSSTGKIKDHTFYEVKMVILGGKTHFLERNNKVSIGGHKDIYGFVSLVRNRSSEVILVSCKPIKRIIMSTKVAIVDRKSKVSYNGLLKKVEADCMKKEQEEQEEIEKEKKNDPFTPELDRNK